MQVCPARSRRRCSHKRGLVGNYSFSIPRLKRFIRRATGIRVLVVLLAASCVAVHANGTTTPPSTKPVVLLLAFDGPSLWTSYSRYILGLILFLIIETALIAVLLLEKRRGRRAQVLLARRFAIEQVISEYSTRLSECPPSQVESECKNVLQAVIDAEEIDGAAWAEISESTKFIRVVCSAERADLQAESMFRGQIDLPWATQALLKGQAVSIDRVDDIPFEGQRDIKCLKGMGVESLALVPASVGDGARGVLILVCQGIERRWPVVLIARLSVLGNICAGAFERKLAIESKQESEQRFRYLFEEAPIGIGLEDLDGRLWFANPALCTMLGYTAEEIRGMNSAQFLDVDDKEEARRLFHELRAGLTGSYQREMRFRRRDGALMWGRFNASLLKGFSADLPLVIVMVTDITERKAAEEKLRSTQRELQQLTATAHPGARGRASAHCARVARRYWAASVVAENRYGHLRPGTATHLDQRACATVRTAYRSR